MSYERQKRATLRKLHGESDCLSGKIERLSFTLDNLPDRPNISQSQGRLMRAQLDRMWEYEDALQERIADLKKELGVEEETE